MSVHDNKQRKFTKQSTNVGPGSYELPSNDVIKSTKPKWTMRMKTAYDTSKLEGIFPGPTNYEPKNKPKAPLFTMGVKYRIQRKSYEEFRVGPGCYNTDTNFYRNKGITFTKAKQRFDKSSDIESSPGPDRYSTMTVKRITGGRIGTSSRRKRNEIDEKELPGPGSYESQSLFEANNQTT